MLQAAKVVLRQRPGWLVQVCHARLGPEGPAAWQSMPPAVKWRHVATALSRTYPESPSSPPPPPFPGSHACLQTQQTLGLVLRAWRLGQGRPRPRVAKAGAADRCVQHAIAPCSCRRCSCWLLRLAACGNVPAGRQSRERASAGTGEGVCEEGGGPVNRCVGSWVCVRAPPSCCSIPYIARPSPSPAWPGPAPHTARGACSSRTLLLDEWWPCALDAPPPGGAEQDTHSLEGTYSDMMHELGGRQPLCPPAGLLAGLPACPSPPVMPPTTAPPPSKPAFRLRCQLTTPLTAWATCWHGWLLRRWLRP